MVPAYYFEKYLQQSEVLISELNSDILIKLNTFCDKGEALSSYRLKLVSQVRLAIACSVVPRYKFNR